METKIRETCTMHDEAYSFQRFGHLQSALKIQEKPLLPLVLPNVEDHRRVIYSIFEYEPLLGMVPNKKSKVTIFGHKKFVNNSSQNISMVFTIQYWFISGVEKVLGHMPHIPLALTMPISNNFQSNAPSGETLKLWVLH